MHFTLKQLEVFLAVASHENVSQAAQELAISQSAASTALKGLEQRFELNLFDRRGKRLLLNEQGQALQLRAAALISQARDLELTLKSRAEVGALKVGATLTIGNYLAIGILASFMKQHPGTRAELTVENTEAIVTKVRKFKLDIGLIECELQEPDLDSIFWRDDELIAFCAPDHPFASTGELSDQQLIEAAWIVREPGSGTRQAFDRAMSGILPDLNLRLELQHTEGVKRAVEAGLGIGCLSRLTLIEAFSRGTLVPLTVPHRNWHRKFYFILHKQKHRSASVMSWIENCRHTA
ncbi:MAG: LysR substrate-binding domain-containing protein [Gammaproteobacteria bacterium]|nr:LysR substrate-binding domain-containing protein [Gammaproteobacteria bacterium]MCY4357727.1 LysR substrate-binding domain-containing protein [Gammaproteobacteria bacterium]